MTAADVTPPAPPPPPPVPPTIAPPLAPPRAPVSVLSVVAFVVIAVTVFLYLIAKTLVPIFDGPSFEKQVDTIATWLGVLGLLALFPIVVAIVLAHLGLRKSQRGRRGRALGVAALALGYLMLVLYFNRILVSIIAFSVFPHGANILQNNFYWS